MTVSLVSLFFFLSGDDFCYLSSIMKFGNTSMGSFGSFLSLRRLVRPASHKSAVQISRSQSLLISAMILVLFCKCLTNLLLMLLTRIFMVNRKITFECELQDTVLYDHLICSFCEVFC
jgi:hypothetical protein